MINRKFCISDFLKNLKFLILDLPNFIKVKVKEYLNWSCQPTRKRVFGWEESDTSKNDHISSCIWYSCFVSSCLLFLVFLPSSFFVYTAVAVTALSAFATIRQCHQNTNLIHASILPVCAVMQTIQEKRHILCFMQHGTS